MLNMGFIRQIEAVFRRIPKKRITLLFSATLPDEIINLTEKYMNRQVNIEVKNEGILTKNIEHYLYRVKGEEKLDYLNRLLIKEVPETAVVFCRTKENVDKAYELLVNKGYSVGKIHGGMLQDDRIKSMNDFKSGEFRILVATDLASRGIDVEKITHVINIDIPVEKEAYVHRIGRSARAGNSGKAITFVTKYEDKYLKEIEDMLLQKIENRDIMDLKCSQEELENGNKMLKKKFANKKRKDANLNCDIVKLYFNGGKKKKLRALDFVGAICSIENVKSEDIGIIEIQDSCSYIEILNGKGKIGRAS